MLSSFNSIHYISCTVVVIALFVTTNKKMTARTKGLSTIILNKTFVALKSSAVLQSLSRLTSGGKSKVPSNLPHLVDFERVSPRTFRILGQNPGPHTLQGTNTWLITGPHGSETEHVLIDTGEDHTADEYLDVLFEKVFPISGTTRLSKIFLTHGHGDHQGGVLKLLEQLKNRNMLPLPVIYKRNVINGKYPAGSFACENIADMQVFELGPETTLQAVHSPGHTDDHVCFLLHQDQALLSGDCVLGCGTTVFDNLFEYMNSLKRVRQILVSSYTMGGSTGIVRGADSDEGSSYNASSNDPFASTSTENKAKAEAFSMKTKKEAGVTYKAYEQGDELLLPSPLPIVTIYPGHGPVIKGTALAKIDEYIHHRDMRENQIVAFLSKNPSEWAPSWEIMNFMYADLSPILKMSALHNVSHHLEKLLAEDRVENTFPDMWRLRK
jgi:glyoxylase-like metal-dependent hydrolase (beta-lactamase superfamily II)